MLETNIPSDLSTAASVVLSERTPNYCPDCGKETVIAGGRLEPQQGWYEHLDPVVMCSVGCGYRSRHTAGVDGEEGREYRQAPGADNWDSEFGDVVGYCDIHGTDMVVTKDLLMGDRPTRQYKCPECDRETVVRARADTSNTGL